MSTENKELSVIDAEFTEIGPVIAPTAMEPATLKANYREHARREVHVAYIRDVVLRQERDHWDRHFFSEPSPLFSRADYRISLELSFSSGEAAWAAAESLRRILDAGGTIEVPV